MSESVNVALKPEMDPRCHVGWSYAQNSFSDTFNFHEYEAVCV